MTIGDQFLEILSSRQSMLLGGGDQDGKASVSTCLDNLCESSENGTPIRYEDEFSRWQSIMVDLGFARVEWGAKRLHVEYPALTMLPTPEADTAILVGARSSSYLNKAKIACDDLSLQMVTTEVSSDRQTGVPAAFYPAKVLFKGDRKDLEALAGELKAKWFPIPLSYLLSKEENSLPPNDLWQDSPFATGGEWFNPQTLGFDGAQPTDTASLGLCRYVLQNQNNRPRLNLFGWQCPPAYPRSGPANDPRGAKWLLLKQSDIRLACSEDLDKIAVPLHCPLPVSLSRALTLCTGEPPRVEKRDFGPELGFAPCVADFLIYDGIHPVIAATVSKSLGCQMLIKI